MVKDAWNVREGFVRDRVPDKNHVLIFSDALSYPWNHILKLMTPTINLNYGTFPFENELNAPKISYMCNN